MLVEASVQSLLQLHDRLTLMRASKDSTEMPSVSDLQASNEVGACRVQCKPTQEPRRCDLPLRWLERRP